MLGDVGEAGGARGLAPGAAAPSAGPSAPGSRAGRGGAGAGRRWIPGGDSGWWIAAVAAAYTLVQLLSVPAGLGLSWDESVYASQVTPGVPASPFTAPRARGVPLLVAPVTELTTSTTALRVCLAVVSGLGLLAALWSWRTLRPAWMVALAGVLFAGLWVTQFYGPQAMPNLWVALSGLAAAGCFLRVSSAGRPGWGAQLGLAVSLAAAALFRPSDALWLALPMAVAAVLARPPGAPSGRWQWRERLLGAPAGWWRWRGRLLGLVVGGLAAGAAEWAGEAYLRFGGLAARMSQSSQAEGGFGLHVAVFDEVKALNGPTLCRPCTVAWKFPELSAWWFVLPLLAALGAVVSVRASRCAGDPDRRVPSLLPALCGICVAVPYLFLINYSAPRFLLPAYALLAIPVADGLRWLMVRPAGTVRPGIVTAVVAAIAIQLLAQHLVLDRAVRRTMIDHTEFSRIVADLRAIGVRPPCLLTGEQAIPVAFYARCSSAEIGGMDASVTAPGVLTASAREPTAVLAYPGQRRPAYARQWRRYPLPGTRRLRLVAYLPPRPPG